MDKIRIVLDPFLIFNGDGITVFDAQSEKRAFAIIDGFLKNHSVNRNALFIVKGVACCKHFESYKNITSNLIYEEITPRRRLQEVFNRDLPKWLTDEYICNCRLLEMEPRLHALEDGWPAIICSMFMPDITKANTLTSWLKVTAQANNFPKEAYTNEVKEWVVENFKSIVLSCISSSEAVRYFVDKLSNTSTPSIFSREVILRAALLPLLIPSSPLRRGELNMGSLVDLSYSKYIPFKFPQDAIDEEYISKHMVAAVRKARLDKKDFASVVLTLNALWKGIAGELDRWLIINPQAMTVEVSQHLSILNKDSNDKNISALIEYYSPPEEVPKWNDLDACFDEWVNKYSHFIRKSFLRRHLPSFENDPAHGFSNWLKENYTVSLHREKGYRIIAHTIQNKIKEGRLVIVLMIDALAIHLMSSAINQISNALCSQPTRCKFLFVPVPTLTEICKNSVLTGLPPKECHSNLISDLMNVYKLDNKEITITSSWNDAERVEIGDHVKLLVYKNNSIDDQLDMAGNYRSLLESCDNIFLNISQVVRRWRDDYNSTNKSQPFILLTSDHGFTYGPPPGMKTEFNVVLDGKRRCVQLDKSLSFTNNNYTIIDKELFKLKNSYLAARGRHFGVQLDTLSGWSMSHGGLLPEEVIVPMVEWFGNDTVTPWLDLSFCKDACYDRGYWLLSVILTNKNNIPVPKGQLNIRVANQGEYCNININRIEPGRKIEIEVRIPDHNSVHNNPCFDVIQVITNYDGSNSSKKHEQYIVPKANQLIERTAEQDDFENMF